MVFLTNSAVHSSKEDVPVLAVVGTSSCGSLSFALSHASLFCRRVCFLLLWGRGRSSPRRLKRSSFSIHMFTNHDALYNRLCVLFEELEVFRGRVLNSQYQVGSTRVVIRFVFFYGTLVFSTYGHGGFVGWFYASV